MFDRCPFPLYVTKMLEVKSAEAGCWNSQKAPRLYISLSPILTRLFFTSAIKELEPSNGRQFRMQQGINLQAIANSHVTLIVVKLFTTEFERYRRDRSIPLGGNLTSLTKVFKDDVEGCG